MFHENQQIGFYTLIKKLGRGGFGEVWLAERRAKFVTTKVAVKLPLDEQVDHEAIKHEATLWEQASGHPNIVPIIDADEYAGQIVIVSEYAPDGSLEEWLKKHGQMPVERAIETTIQILDGLEFLHSRNIIHRDLKPANILLQGKTPRLADFGISRALRTTVASQSQNISGTFAYMSPEALDGKRSVQTDVWSVGVNLYQFLTGTLPFPQKEPSVLFPAIIMREFAPLPDSIPQSLKNVIARALAKLPENRYKNASEMREDLRRILRGEMLSLQTFPSKETIVIPTNLAKKLTLDELNQFIKKQNLIPKDNTPETETVVKPKAAPNFVKLQSVGSQPNLNDTKDVFSDNKADNPSAVGEIKTEGLKTKKTKWLNGLVLVASVIVIGLCGLFAISFLIDTMNRNSQIKKSGNSNSSTDYNFSKSNNVSTTNVFGNTNQRTYTEPKVKQKPSKRNNVEAFQECVLSNNGNNVNVRANCDTADCDADDSTIVSSIPSGTPVNVLDIRGVQSANGFEWIAIVGSNNTVLWVASTKLDCGGD